MRAFRGIRTGIRYTCFGPSASAINQPEVRAESLMFFSDAGLFRYSGASADTHLKSWVEIALMFHAVTGSTTYV